MKRTVLTTTLMVWFATAFSQTRLQAHSSFASVADSVSMYPSIESMVQDILDVTGINTSFVIRAAEVRNMQARVSRRKRLILYNPVFVKWLYETTHDKWAAVTLLAHEIGHHLKGHTQMPGGSRPAVELEADEFAGFALNRLGATLSQAQEVMLYVASNRGSSTHPAREARMKAIERGWMLADSGP